MSFVSDEVVEKVNHVGGKVLPRSGRHRAAARDAETYQRDHRLAAASERSFQLRRPDCVRVHRFRNCDAVTAAEHLNPRAPGVVNMRRERAHCATRRAGNRR